VRFRAPLQQIICCKNSRVLQKHQEVPNTIDMLQEITAECSSKCRTCFTSFKEKADIEEDTKVLFY
jgi:hypothetical protein